jgi:hypothetical protein
VFGPSGVARWTVRGIIAAAGFVAGMVLVLAVVDQAERVEPARDDLGVVDVRAIRAELMVERHHCWTGEAPPDMRGKIPGGVLAARPGHPVELLRGRWVGRALDQVFEGVEHGLRVYAFCR